MKCKARSSIGKDASLSSWKEGFDSPTGYNIPGSSNGRTCGSGP